MGCFTTADDDADFDLCLWQARRSVGAFQRSVFPADLLWSRSLDSFRRIPDAGRQQSHWESESDFEGVLSEAYHSCSLDLSALLDFAISFAVLVLLVYWKGIPFRLTMIWVPVFILFAVIAALAVGLWLSALNVEFRDVRYAIPFLTQFWMLASPVGYSSHEVPARWQAVYGLNPMSGVIEGFRWALLGTPPPSAPMMLASAAAIVFLLVGGLFYFRRMEKSFADLI